MTEDLIAELNSLKKRLLDLEGQFAMLPEKYSMHPHCVLTMGPTGSGKSLLMQKATEQLGIEDFVKVLVDDLVEMDHIYKKKVIAILKKHGLDPTDDSERFKNVMVDPPQDLFEDFTNAYFDVRNKVGCQTYNIRQDPSWNCDSLNDEILKSAVENKKHIVFETTGKNVPRWLLNMIKPQGYRVIAAYSLVEFCELVKRNKFRAWTSTTTFLTNVGKEPAPRLPNVLDTKTVDDGSYKKTVKEIRRLLKNILGVSNGKYDTPEVHFDRILIYNNNSDMTLTHDISPKDLKNKTLMIQVAKSINDMMFISDELCSIKKYSE